MYNITTQRVEEHPVARSVDVRTALFDAAADMPADITSSANVSADRIKFDGFSSGARKFLLTFNPGVSTYSGTNGAGPICTGVRVSIDAEDDVAADARLVADGLSPGGGAGPHTNSTGKVDTFTLGNGFFAMEVTSSAAISRIDVIGIPVKVTPTSIVPSFFEVVALG